MSLINIENLAIRYGNVTAVDGLNLQVHPGEVVGLLGGNGAGKSSTLRAISGVNRHTSGLLEVCGYDMADPTQVEQVRRLIGYCPDVGGLVRQATVREHIGIALAMHGNTHLWPQALDMLELFNLTEVLDRVTQGFSHGMCRRLSVLLAALTAQRVLVLDEPFDGVDPLGVEATLRSINIATEAGVGVLISTHLLDLVVEACDRVVVVVDGKAVTSDTADSFAGEQGKRKYANLLRRLSNPDGPDPLTGETRLRAPEPDLAADGARGSTSEAATS